MDELRGLWRGKSKDTDEWLEGYLLRYAGTTQIWVKEGNETNNYVVDPATLGECTGLTDKNKNLVFEGDIIKTKKYGKVVGHSNVNDYDIFVVKYEPALFRLEKHNRGFNLVNDGYSKLEIIGNIHDNPELMEHEEGAKN